MKFWEMVKTAIKAQNTTQDWIAHEIGVSIGTFRNWIYYNRIPTGDMVYKIAEALNVSVEYLITGTEKYRPKKARKPLMDICEMIEILSDEELLEMKGVVKSYIQTNYQKRESAKKNLA